MDRAAMKIFNFFSGQLEFYFVNKTIKIQLTFH